MKSLKSAFLILFLSFIAIQFSSCDRYKTMQLKGQWKAVSVVKNNQTFEVPLEEIKLNFTDKAYSFEGTLQYREAGHYSISTPFLYTIDTLDSDSEQKAVQILQLTNDTLEILMDQGGEEMILKMVKEGL
jgi:hypothetical protein